MSKLSPPPAASRPAPSAQPLADQIAEAIATGEYAPGTRLDEIELAARHGVSRTPVREALFQLGAAGLVTLRPRRGAIVPLVSAQQLMEMFEVMAELEAMCARLAARRASPADLAALREAHLASAGAVQAGDPDGYYAQNEIFHHTLYRIAHHGFLEQQALALSRRLRPYRRLQLRVRARLASSFAEHQALVEAICAGDEAGAATQSREHVTVQGERFADLLATLAEPRPD